MDAAIHILMSTAKVWPEYVDWFGLTASDVRNVLLAFAKVKLVQLRNCIDVAAQYQALLKRSPRDWSRTRDFIMTVLHHPGCVIVHCNGGSGLLDKPGGRRIGLWWFDENPDWNYEYWQMGTILSYKKGKFDVAWNPDRQVIIRDNFREYRLYNRDGSLKTIANHNRRYLRVDKKWTLMSFNRYRFDLVQYTDHYGIIRRRSFMAYFERGLCTEICHRQWASTFPFNLDDELPQEVTKAFCDSKNEQ